MILSPNNNLCTPMVDEQATFRDRMFNVHDLQ